MANPKINSECEIAKKLETILAKLLEPNFKRKNDIYLNLLLTHWVGKTENGVSKTSNIQDLNETFFQWIIAVTNTWHEKKIAPSTSVLSFALNVGSQLSTNEDFFIKMRNENVYGKLAELTKENYDFNTGVDVGFIKLLSSVLEHTSGMQWLLTTSYWNDIVTTALKNNNNYIKQKAYQFIIKLLETTIVHDKDFCEELVEILVEPLNVAAVQAEFIKDTEEDNRNMYESLKPTLDLLSEVADTLLKKMNNQVLHIFIETEIPEAVQNILNFSKIEDFSFDLLKIRFVFLFCHLCVKLEKTKKTAHDADTLFDIGIMFDLIRAEIEKDHVKCVIKICYYAHGLYCNLNTRTPLCIRKGQHIEFQNQMMLFQLVPVMAFGQQLLGPQKSKQLALTDDLRQHFYRKLAKISAIKTLEITFRWERRLADKADLLEHVTMSLQYILKSKRIINKEQAAIIFQPLIYSLKDCVTHLDKFRGKPMPLRGINYNNILITTIIELVETFDLTWKDSIETISVLDLACEILQYEYVDYKVTVIFLRLLNVAISKCMSPNMVLLMINTDTVISQIGCLLYEKCQNSIYQIRNMALEVVRTLGLNASTKFPEFTDILFNADLPRLVVNMARNDKEHEVRKTSLKCIQALILVEEIREVYQNDDNFWDELFNIFITEPKGTVRKEAAKLIDDMSKIYNFPEFVSPRVYDIMTHATICDIHWEVKIAALRFWGRMIENHLNYQGLTDRMFPPYVFSKKHKKIVKLTEKEKKRRVIEALNELSNIGAMYVLKKVLDETDIGVLKYGLRIAAGMVELIRAFKVSCDEIDPPSLAGSCGAQSHPVSPASSSSDNQPSPEGQFSSESSQSQYPDSPSSFSELLDISSCSYPLSPDDASLSSPDGTAPQTPSSSDTQDSNVLSPNNTNNNYKDNQTDSAKEEFANVNFFEMDFQEDQFMPLSESDVDLELILAENMDNSVSTDMTETSKLFDDLLQLNDATLLEEIVNNCGCQVHPIIQTRQYIPPSEYVRLCLDVVETKEKNSKQSIQPDEFNLLLNEMINEYYPDR